MLTARLAAGCRQESFQDFRIYRRQRGGSFLAPDALGVRHQRHEGRQLRLGVFGVRGRPPLQVRTPGDVERLHKKAEKVLQDAR